MTVAPPPVPSARAPIPLALRWLLGLFAAAAIAAVAMFVLNPLGTASWDPRLRVLGHAPFRIASSSMAPTLSEGDLVVVSALSLRQRALAVGDVVVFIPPGMPSQAFVSRIAGLAGDRVRIEGGRAWVNDQMLDEPYLRKQTLRRPESLNVAEVSVPAGRFYVLGDNRDNAMDSRYWGFAERDQVVGRVELTLEGLSGDDP
jgi:signal peptidase I